MLNQAALDRAAKRRAERDRDGEIQTKYDGPSMQLHKFRYKENMARESRKKRLEEEERIHEERMLVARGKNERVKVKSDLKREQQEEKMAQIHAEEIMRRTAMRMRNQLLLGHLLNLIDNFKEWKYRDPSLKEEVLDLKRTSLGMHGPKSSPFDFWCQVADALMSLLSVKKISQLFKTEEVQKKKKVWVKDSDGTMKLTEERSFFEHLFGTGDEEAEASEEIVPEAEEARESARDRELALNAIAAITPRVAKTAEQRRQAVKQKMEQLEIARKQEAARKNRGPTSTYQPDLALYESLGVSAESVASEMKILEEMNDKLSDLQEQLLNEPRSSPTRKALKEEIKKLDVAISERHEVSVLNERRVRQQMSRNWSPFRKQGADKLFDVFDLDGGGDIDIDEFTFMVRSFDPNVSRAEIQETFESVGAEDGALERFQFYVWIDEVFGELDDEAFTSVLHEMTEDCGDLEPSRKAWSNRVFTYCDADNSGYLDLQEFTSVILKVAPEVSTADIRKTLQNAGVDMDNERTYPHHFHAWIHDVFGEVGPYDFERSMLAIVTDAAGSAQLR